MIRVRWRNEPVGFLSYEQTVRELETKLNEGREVNRINKENEIANLVWFEQPEGVVYWQMAYQLFETYVDDSIRFDQLEAGDFFVYDGDSYMKAKDGNAYSLTDGEVIFLPTYKITHKIDNKFKGNVRS